MKDYVFNEKQAIEAMINANFVDDNNPTNTIKNLLGIIIMFRILIRIRVITLLMSI